MHFSISMFFLNLPKKIRFIIIIIFFFFPFGEPSARRIKFVSIASKEYLQYFLVFFFTPSVLASILVTSAHNSPNRLFFLLFFQNVFF